LKRLLDIVGASVGLLVSAPLILPIMLLVWLQDRRSPLYIAERIGAR
jgi:lipopolysaccharide/colanic/teichoic acid biosynthesis glycosyltransferase